LFCTFVCHFGPPFLVAYLHFLSNQEITPDPNTI
jgi:hypothetical protein